LENR
jgi:hypothetical protein